MIVDLTPDQWAKVARGWVWRPGHAALWTKENGVVLRARYIRPIMGGRRCEIMGERGHTWRPVPRELTPRLDDDVTADGLLRTARAMWEAKILERYGFGVHLFAICRGHKWNISVCDAGAGELFVRPVGVGGTEEDAWLAAILAAPEPT